MNIYNIMYIKIIYIYIYIYILYIYIYIYIYIIGINHTFKYLNIKYILIKLSNIHFI